MNLSRIAPALFNSLQDDDVDPTLTDLVGTPERPVELSLADHPRALTGVRASRHEASVYKSLAEDPEADVLVPLNTRSARRRQARNAARQQRNGQRAYTRRELLKERVVADLAQQFNIVDGHVPARQSTRDRVMLTLSAKADLLIEQGATEQQAWSQLRGLASGKVDTGTVSA